MKKQGTQKSSQSDDVPIPSAHTCGRTTRLAWVINRAKQSNISFSGKSFTNKLITAGILAVLLVPSFLSNPEPVVAISEAPVELEKVFADTVPAHWDPTLVAILENEIARHEIENDAWPERLDSYINMVKHIESDNKRNAYNPSGAMSYFQFKGESLKTAHYRLINYMRRYELGAIPTWSRDIYYRPNRIYNTTADKQATLMIINIIELDREVGTSYFRHFLDGDNQAGLKAYYKYHHTAPDKQTIKRTEQLFVQYF